MRRIRFLVPLRKRQQTLLRLPTMPHTSERVISNSLDIHIHMLSTPRCFFVHLWGRMPSLRRYTSLPVYPSARLSFLLGATDIRSFGSGTLPRGQLPSMHCRSGSTYIAPIRRRQRQYLVGLCWRPIIVGRPTLDTSLLTEVHISRLQRRSLRSAWEPKISRLLLLTICSPFP